MIDQLAGFKGLLKRVVVFVVRYVFFVNRYREWRFRRWKRQKGWDCKEW